EPLVDPVPHRDVARGELQLRDLLEPPGLRDGVSSLGVPGIAYARGDGHEEPRRGARGVRPREPPRVAARPGAGRLALRGVGGGGVARGRPTRGLPVLLGAPRERAADLPFRGAVAHLFPRGGPRRRASDGSEVGGSRRARCAPGALSPPRSVSAGRGLGADGQRSGARPLDRRLGAVAVDDLRVGGALLASSPAGEARAPVLRADAGLGGGLCAGAARGDVPAVARRTAPEHLLCLLSVSSARSSPPALLRPLFSARSSPHPSLLSPLAPMTARISRPDAAEIGPSAASSQGRAAAPVERSANIEAPAALRLLHIGGALALMIGA